METEAKAKSSRLFFWGKICCIPCRASCFTSVDLEEKVELNEFILFSQIDRGKKASATRY